ncbi:7769_t:CDS:2 [Ambispora leptoticha]|uniref:Ammonium transporter n=1 Tax=Ambispora leptoticha TaxID=144679 RepID=A0A9N9D0F5_9GLOM|nr:7769_t:CDS:2 [Ambispora leptoticha]
MSNNTTTTDPTYQPGDIVFVLISTTLVWIMIPGLGYFYSGMARSKNALSLILLCCASVAVVSIQWWVFGYSLAFSKTGGKFIGNLDNAFFIGVGNDPSFASESIPDSAYAIFQCMFAAITPALAIGAAAERGRTLPTLVFVFIWSTLIYDPIACWVWGKNGWSKNLGALDFAGGTPIETASGAAALAYCLVLGKRAGHGVDDFKPHNIANVILGAVLLWFGWFGFNGGSALAGNARAINAFIVTNLAASAGGITWMVVDYRIEHKWSALSFCLGAVAGMVCITPGCGYVGSPASILFGVAGGTICNFAIKLKDIFDFDDALDVWAVHGVGGIIGNILTAIFAQRSIAMLGGEDIAGGWLDRHWIQLGYNLAPTIAGCGYSFFGTYLILYIMDKFPGLSLRADPEAEAKGLDESELGELAYYHVDRLITVNTRTGETKTIKEETLHQTNDTNPAIV